MAVAAFDAGVDSGVEIAGEGAFLGLQIETRPGRAVICMLPKELNALPFLPEIHVWTMPPALP
ncbi:MAG: hypothetical protein PF443_09655, partial [Allgaiera sp.]|nr:hypothetical protein [Allgaiera sp.]